MSHHFKYCLIYCITKVKYLLELFWLIQFQLSLYIFLLLSMYQYFSIVYIRLYRINLVSIFSFQLLKLCIEKENKCTFVKEIKMSTVEVVFQISIVDYKMVQVQMSLSNISIYKAIFGHSSCVYYDVYIRSQNNLQQNCISSHIKLKQITMYSLRYWQFLQRFMDCISQVSYTLLMIENRSMADFKTY